MGEKNENVELLIDFCKDEELVATNNWLEHRIKNRYTWMSPDGQSKNQKTSYYCHKDIGIASRTHKSDLMQTVDKTII